MDELLADLRPGQAVTVHSVVAHTGLDRASVGIVLEALTRAEIFEKVNATTFVRDSLMKTAD